MNLIRKIALITFASVFFISTVLNLKSIEHFKSFLGTIGAMSFAIGICTAVVGFVLTRTSNAKEIGKGILLGSGLAILIGFGVCTSSF